MGHINSLVSTEVDTVLSTEMDTELAKICSQCDLFV